MNTKQTTPPSSSLSPISSKSSSKSSIESSSTSIQTRSKQKKKKKNNHQNQLKKTKRGKKIKLLIDKKINQEEEDESKTQDGVEEQGEGEGEEVILETEVTAEVVEEEEEQEELAVEGEQEEEGKGELEQEEDQEQKQEEAQEQKQEEDQEQKQEEDQEQKQEEDQEQKQEKEKETDQDQEQPHQLTQQDQQQLQQLQQLSALDSLSILSELATTTGSAIVQPHHHNHNINNNNQQELSDAAFHAFLLASLPPPTASTSAITNDKTPQHDGHHQPYLEPINHLPSSSSSSSSSSPHFQTPHQLNQSLIDQLASNSLDRPNDPSSSSIAQPPTNSLLNQHAQHLLSALSALQSEINGARSTEHPIEFDNHNLFSPFEQTNSNHHHLLGTTDHHQNHEIDLESLLMSVNQGTHDEHQSQKPEREPNEFDFLFNQPHQDNHTQNQIEEREEEDGEEGGEEEEEEEKDEQEKLLDEIIYQSELERLEQIDKTIAEILEFNEKYYNRIKNLINVVHSSIDRTEQILELSNDYIIDIKKPKNNLQSTSSIIYLQSINQNNNQNHNNSFNNNNNNNNNNRVEEIDQNNNKINNYEHMIILGHQNIKSVSLPYFKYRFGQDLPCHSDGIKRDKYNSILHSQAWQPTERKKLEEEVVLQIGSSRESTELIDWKRISEQLPDRSIMECKIQWNQRQRPNLNKTKWNTNEIDKLFEIVKRRESKDWKAISDELNTGRSPSECVKQYRMVTQERREWNETDDFLLKEGVSMYGQNWQAVANHCGRSSNQCINRWSKTLRPDIKKGKWDAIEDEALKNAVAACGMVWKDVAPRVRGRTDAQCRERWCNILDPRIVVGNWTKDEDSKILKMRDVERKTWSEISKSFDGRRTDNHCMRRYSELTRTETKKQINSISTNHNNNNNHTSVTSLSKTLISTTSLTNNLLASHFSNIPSSSSGSSGSLNFNNNRNIISSSSASGLNSSNSGSSRRNLSDFERRKKMRFSN